MSVWHRRSLRKKSGGKTRRSRKSRKFEKGEEFAETELGEHRIEKRDTMGGNTKNVAKRAEQINLATDDGVESVSINSVEDNPANPNFVRRSLLTKGTIVDTPKGKARITSRPGQEGVVNGELLE